MISSSRLRAYQALYDLFAPSKKIKLTKHRNEELLQKNLLRIIFKNSKGLSAAKQKNALIVLSGYKAKLSIPQFHQLITDIASEHYALPDSLDLIEFTCDNKLASSHYQGKTILHQIAKKLLLSTNNESAKKKLYSKAKIALWEKIIGILISYGADIHQKDNEHNQPPRYFAKSETVRRLLSSGPTKTFARHKDIIKIALINNVEDPKAKGDIYFADQAHTAFLELIKTRKIAQNIQIIRLAASDVSTLNTSFDAIIIPGNSRDYPEYTTTLKEWKKSSYFKYVDQQNVAAIDYAKKCQIPYLGLCAGKQLITLYHNGRIDEITGHDYTEHDITITPGSLLHKAQLGELDTIAPYRFNRKGKKLKPLSVHSDHHYSTRIGSTDNIRILALAPDEEQHAEAITTKDELMLGLQFHPEYDIPVTKKSIENQEQLQNILIYFAEQAKIYHYQKLFFQNQFNISFSNNKRSKAYKQLEQTFKNKQVLNQSFKSMVNHITLQEIIIPKTKEFRRRPDYQRFWELHQTRPAIQAVYKPVRPIIKRSKQKLKTSDSILYFQLNRRFQAKGKKRTQTDSQKFKQKKRARTLNFFDSTRDSSFKDDYKFSSLITL